VICSEKIDHFQAVTAHKGGLVDNTVCG